MIFLVLMTLLSTLLEGIGVSLVPVIISFVMSEDSIIVRGFDISHIINSFGQENLAYVFLAFFSFLMIVKSAFSVFLTKYSVSLVLRIRDEWRIALFRYYMSVPMGSILKTPTGEIIENLISQTERASKFVNFLFKMFANFVVLLVMFFVLFQASAHVTVIVGSVFCAAAGLSVFFVKKVASQIGRKELKFLQLSSSVASEAVNGIQQIRIFGLEPRWENEFHNASFLQGMFSTRAAVLAQVISSVGVLLLVFLVFLVLMFGGESFSESVPLLALFVIVGQRVQASLSGLVQAYAKLRSLKPSYDLVLNNVNKVNRSSVRSDAVLPQTIETLTFKNVSFSFDDVSPVLNNVSLTLNRGKFYVVSGKSGSGKSTLVNIICGFLQPSSGKVLVNKTDLASVSPKAWLANISLVSQESFLFKGSIEENIALGAEKVSSEKFSKALERAGVDELLKRLPKGLQTHLGERGKGLSGGQVQRVAIARALVRKAAIFIFDEATSALDKKNQDKIIASMRALADEGHIVIAISHSQEVISAADVGIELIDGALVANLH
jgi:ABC-type bacteriocin/lantibiotic exporter with double-glycine peptidase domain